MLYSFAKMLMTAGLRFFYRHVYVTGLENVPLQGPVVLIANHNASLMDAALVGILLKRKAYFFTRGDVFVNKPVQKILWWLHMVPVHSYQGGRHMLEANDHSFSAGRQILLNGGMIVFFPESTSHPEHRLLPFRKGVFRLAFDTAAAASFEFDIPIVPIGITYDHPVDCRTDVQLHAGKPLLLSAYKEEYHRNAAAALLHICKDAYQAILNLALHVADANRLQTAEQYIDISRNDNPVSASVWKIASAHKLKREQDICAAVGQASLIDFEIQQQKMRAYFTALSAAGLKDKTTAHFFSFPGWKKALLWLGFPFYLTGLLLNGLPVLIARQTADKKVSRQDFYSWIFVVCYSFGYFFWMIALLLAALLAGWHYLIGVVVVVVVTGLFAYLYKDWLHDSRQQKKWKSIPFSAKNELRSMREDCKSTLQL